MLNINATNNQLVQKALFVNPIINKLFLNLYCFSFTTSIKVIMNKVIGNKQKKGNVISPTVDALQPEG